MEPGINDYLRRTTIPGGREQFRKGGDSEKTTASSRIRQFRDNDDDSGRTMAIPRKRGFRENDDNRGNDFWNNHDSNRTISSELSHLKKDNQCIKTTISCEDRQFQVEEENTLKKIQMTGHQKVRSF